jgi:hypothetical protein
VTGNFGCALLAWLSPWFGYGGALATVLLFLLVPSPPDSEDKFVRGSRAHRARSSSGLQPNFKC